MLNNNEKLIEDILESFSNDGIDSKEIIIIEKCFDDEIKEEDFCEVLSHINVKKIDFYERKNMIGCIKRLFECGDKEVCSKYMRIIICVYKDMLFENYYTYEIIGRKSKEILNVFEEYNIPSYYFILYKGKRIATAKDMTPGNFEELKKIYITDKKNYKKALEIANDRTKAFLVAAVIMESKEQMKQLEIYLKSFIQQKFDEATGNKDSLQFAIIMSYITCDKFKESTQNLKSLLMSQHEQSFVILSTYLENNYCEYNYNKVVKTKVNRVNKEMNMLIKKIEVPMEYYIHFMSERYIRDCNNDLTIYKENIYKSDKEVIRKAILLCGSKAIEILILASYFWNIGEGSEFIEMAEEKILNEFKVFLQKEEFTDQEVNNFYEYSKGNRELGKIELPKSFRNKYISRYNYRETFRTLFLIKDTSSIFDRIVKYIMEIKNGDIFETFMTEFLYSISKDENDLLELLKKVNIKMDKALPLLSYIKTEIYQQELNKKATNLLDKLFEEKTQEVLLNIGECNAGGREYWITKISKSYKKVNITEEEYYEILIKYVGDYSKNVRTIVIEYINENEKCIQKLIPLLSAKKAQIRESVVMFLGNNLNDNYKKLLEDRLDQEKNSKVKNLIIKYLNIESSIENNTKNQIEDNVFEYCKKNLDKRKKAKVEWLNPAKLPKLKLKDSKKEVSEEIVYYILNSFVETCSKEVKLNLEVKNIALQLDEETLKNFSFEILNKWINEGAEAKKRWVLSLAAMFGDSRVIELLNFHIKQWAIIYLRGAIASQAVKALALCGSDKALMLVDNISRNINHKQVKNAAIEALEFAAKELSIDPEELADKLIPTLEFDEKGEQIFDYGNRKFIVNVDSQLQLVIFKEDGKQLKNLPAVGKNDIEEIAKKSREQFKTLKKGLKELIGIQGRRLEGALSVNRIWTRDKWKKIFVSNVLMQKFALGLIWGVYEKNNLIQSFRYMEDGSFNTLNEEEYELLENAEIGLLHPVELRKEDIEAWREQLSDYEIKQPFKQLSRETFKITQEIKENKTFKDFSKTIFSEYEIMKFQSMNWNKGMILDGGGYTEFYKENSKLGIIAEVCHSGLCVGYISGEDVTLEEVVFYNSQDYNKIGFDYKKKLTKRLKLKDIPQRFYSEVMYDVSKVTLNNKGKSER